MSELTDFDDFLNYLLNETRLFTLEQWQEFLGVDPFVFNTWLEYSIPDPESLRSILRVLLQSDGVTGVEERLGKIADKPLYTISRYNAQRWRSAHTLGEYLCIPLVDGLHRAMAGLTYREREQVLVGAGEAARKLREAREQKS